MRGGGGLSVGLNQTIDFIFYSGDKVLLKPNVNVVNGNRNYAFLGTFAVASIGGLVSLGAVKKNKIKLGVETKSPTPLDPYEMEERAIAILQNDLGFTEEEAIAEIVKSKQISSNEDNTNFFTVEGDKRLSEDGCNEDTCMIKTQVYAVNVKNPDMFEKNGAKWFSYSNIDDLSTEPIFFGHLKILKEAIGQFSSSEGGSRRTRKRKGKKSKKSKKGRKTRKHRGRKHSGRKHH